MSTEFTVPGLTSSKADKTIDLLSHSLVGLTDLALTLKHIHWNVVGPSFIAVHELLDTQVAGVRLLADQVAERIATLGGVPVGTPGHLVEQRTWNDYSVGRADTQEHLAALDLVYGGVLGDLRDMIATLDDLDLVTQDLIISAVGQLEQYQWFVRAHMEDRNGHLVHHGATTEQEAVDAARKVRAVS